MVLGNNQGPILKYWNFKYLNIGIFKYSNTRKWAYWNIGILKCLDIKISNIEIMK